MNNTLGILLAMALALFPYTFSYKVEWGWGQKEDNVVYKIYDQDQCKINVRKRCYE